MCVCDVIDYALRCYSAAYTHRQALCAATNVTTTPMTTPCSGAGKLAALPAASECVTVTATFLW